MSATGAADVAVLAQRLQTAWRERAPIAPLGAAGALSTVEQAYATQRAWAALRAAEGETTVGRKIGLTSPGMRRQMGVDEPDFGDLWGSRQAAAPDLHATFRHADFIQPRVEGEIAFLMRDELAGPGVEPADVLAAAEAAALAIEVVDSRIADWRIALVDTIADNASYGGFACGAFSRELLHADLPALELTLARGGETCVRERGAAVLGSPLAAVAWLANRLGSFGLGIRAGDVVLSGSVGGAVAVAPGDAFELSAAGQPTLTADFEEGSP